MRADCAAAAAPAAAAGPAAGAWRARLPRGPGWATVDPACAPALRPVICGCCCAGTAEVRGVGACRAMAEAGGPPDGRADCCGPARRVCAVRGAAACGAARGAAMCGAARGVAICGAALLGADACGAGAARGAAACGAARGAAMCGAACGVAICGAALGADACGAGAARGAGAAGAGRAAGAPPPCLCCGCAAAVVAIAAETIKTVAMRVFHWNMTAPPTSPTTQRQKWRAGFACEGAAAYMGLTWRATNSLTICSELRARNFGGQLEDARGAPRRYPLC